MNPRTSLRARRLGRQASCLALAAALSTVAGAAQAQQADVSAPVAAPTDQVEEVVVTGYRAALQSALNLKRSSNVMVDAINAEDIADFPDANLAESLQRLPGVSIDRDNGEGRTITVRGLGSDFTRVRLNGLEALSTAGANDSGTQPNRSRGFDFNTFASELFSSLRVQKTASAETDEGSLGATIDLITGRPLNFSKARLALSVQDAYYPNGKHNNPRVAGLVSNRWDTGWGQFGALVSLAYNERDQTTDSYLRNAGVSDYTYRGSTFAGTPNPTAGNSTLTRQGFAAPTGTACNNGVIPGANITNAQACAAMTGSNPLAYALINSPIGATLSNNGAGAFTSAPGSLIRIPALPTINQQQLHQERLGVTGSVQWRSPNEKTTVSADGLYSRFYNDSINYQVMVVGLNRNNTAANYNTASDATTLANKRGLYNTCVSRAATAIQGAIDCGETTYGGALVPGTSFSYNPNNLEPYDYYNSPSSVGYVPISASNPYGLGQRDAMIGRPAVKLLDARLSESGANADYLKLGNVDIRSAADQQYYTTFFQQGSINIEHEFSDKFRMSSVFGQSRSYNKSTGLLVDYIRLDSGQGVPGNDYLVYDEGEGGMPLLNLGFDPANPANWDFVKNYSQLVVYHRKSDNRYKGGKLDFAYDLDDDFTVKFGFGKRQFRFDTSMEARTINATLNPSLQEAKTSVADTSKLITFGKGLNAPEGTATSFLAPDMDKFLNLFDFNCNCINKWGDYRTTIFANAANTYGVVEDDTGAFVQFDFRRTLFDRTLRGNVGVRYAITDLETTGLTNTARPISATNKYTDVLPSLNAAYELSDKMMIRLGVADVMARPLLGNLAPSVTSFSAPSEAGATTGGAITLGNPKLQPFRATNYDLSFEWYFAPGALFSAAIFDKEVHSFPQTIIASSTLSGLLTPDIISSLRASQTNLNSLAYIDADLPFDVRQFRDAPGGYIRGVELSYQQNLTFLPWWLNKFGIQANYTHLESELQYILDPSAPATRTTAARPQVISGGPFTGASPDAFNFTLFYEAEKWSARVSTAYRAGYFTQYPVASGSCDPGVCDSPLVNDFIGSKATTNVDGSFSYQFSPNFSMQIEALNLTNQKSERFGYADDPVVTSYAAPGRQFFFGVRFTY